MSFAKKTREFWPRPSFGPPFAPLLPSLAPLQASTLPQIIFSPAHGPPPTSVGFNHESYLSTSTAGLAVATAAFYSPGAAAAAAEAGEPPLPHHPLDFSFAGGRNDSEAGPSHRTPGPTPREAEYSGQTGGRPLASSPPRTPPDQLIRTPSTPPGAPRKPRVPFPLRPPQFDILSATEPVTRQLR